MLTPGDAEQKEIQLGEFDPEECNRKAKEARQFAKEVKRQMERQRNISPGLMAVQITI